MDKLFQVLLILFSGIHFIYAQISPPGLGHQRTAGWVAAGVRQQMNTKWQSMTYLGVGRTSSSNSVSPAITVINQEFYRKLPKNMQYSLALSFRNQKEEAPIPNESIYKQELRLYGRISYTVNTSAVKIVPTFRQELRKFFVPGVVDEAETFQLRSRLRLQMSVNINTEHTEKVILSSEQLFSAGKNRPDHQWSHFKYGESRFAIFYSVSPKKLPLTFDIGYMNNLVGRKDPYSVSYIALDIIFENPLTK